MIKNIIFDMGQVLIRFTPDLFLDEMGYAGEDKETLLREVFRKVEWVQLDHGTITEEEAVKSVCRRVPERLHKAVEDLIYRWWEHPLVPVPGMAALMQELKQAGYRLYLLSNASVQQIKYHDRIPGTEYLDGRVVSAECKLIKPGHEIYRYLLDRYQLEACECVFIDDAPANVEAALCVGIHGILFENTEKLRQDLRESNICLL